MDREAPLSLVASKFVIYASTKDSEAKPKPSKLTLSLVEAYKAKTFAMRKAPTQKTAPARTKTRIMLAGLIELPIGMQQPVKDRIAKLRGK